MPKFVLTCVRTITYTKVVEAENDNEAFEMVNDGATDYDEWDVIDDTSYIEDDVPEVEE